MVQQINRSNLEVSRPGLSASRIGNSWNDLARVSGTPHETEIGFDIETTGLNPRENKMIMVQLKSRGKKVVLLDVRDEDPKLIRQVLLPLLSDNKRLFTGQNLLFELSWMLAHLGIGVDQIRARFNDTMLRELVILGLGQGDAYKKGLATRMDALGERYGIPVHKDEQSWFINLDKPRRFYQDGSYSFQTEKGIKWFHGDHTPYDDEEERPGEDTFDRETDEQWHQPFPQKILEYGRQDVAVVHLISDKQQELIDEYGLQEVIDIETRVLPAVAGMQYYGLRVDREKWMGFIDAIDARAEELADELHIYVDVPVLEHRRQAHLEKAQPYQEWVRGRDALVDKALEAWPKTKGGKPKTGWGDHKQGVIDAYTLLNPKPKPPTALKDGVNLNSSDQMVVALRSRGHAIDSVKEEILTPLATDPVVQLLLDYKDFNTARTKYGQQFLDEHASQGILYASIQQLGAETGRFSFKEPNVQQVPSKGAGEHLREAIVPREGYVFVDADFVNVELMIAAYITRDPVMLQAFADGEDLHARTAEVMFGLRNNPEYLEALENGVTPKDWTKTHKAVVRGQTLGAMYREIAKTINFGLLYGMGAYRLAATLRIPVDTAKELMRLYRETYSVAVGWLRRQGNKVENPDQDGRVFASTLSGRRRWFTLPTLQVDKNTKAAEALEAQDKYKRQLAEIQRQLGNHPIQGTSADITKLAIALWQERYNCDEVRLVATIHDELLLEVLDIPELIEEANRHLGEVMHEALTHFLKGMVAKVPVGVVADHWQH